MTGEKRCKIDEGKEREKESEKIRRDREQRGKTGRRRWIEVESLGTVALGLDASSESLRSERILEITNQQGKTFSFIMEAALSSRRK